MTNTITSIITAIHLAALSQIESGDKDKAIGKDGEVSRYQIAPEVWQSELARKTFSARHPENPEIARAVAESVWRGRVAIFRLEFNRNPTLMELYLLWHRPARVLSPRPRERERAARFMNLVLSLQNERTGK